MNMKKWIVPVAALALLSGLHQGARAEDMPTTEPAAGKATITVTVTDADAKPIEGARVMLYPAAMKKAKTTAADDTPATPPAAPPAGKRAKALQTVTTDKDGKAMLTKVADGTYSVGARMKGYVAARETVTIVDDKDMSISLTLKSRNAPAAPTN